MKNHCDGDIFEHSFRLYTIFSNPEIPNFKTTSKPIVGFTSFVQGLERGLSIPPKKGLPNKHDNLILYQMYIFKTFLEFTWTLFQNQYFTEQT